MVGEFTRTTAHKYVAVAVWRSAHSEKYGAPKNRGYGISWHRTQEAAEKKRSESKKWHHPTEFIGVFPVTQEGKVQAS